MTNFYNIVYPAYRRAAKLMCGDCKQYIKRGSKILDLGCGSGIVSREFQRYYASDLVGVDIVDNRIMPVPFKLINGKDLPFGDNTFDAVLISYVLHHTDDPLRVLDEAKRVAKGGGKIVIFEDLYEGFLAKIICNLHGMSYGLLFEHHGGKETYHFYHKKRWLEIFKVFDLKLLSDRRVSSRFYPVHKHLFILEKS